MVDAVVNTLALLDAVTNQLDDNHGSRLMLGTIERIDAKQLRLLLAHGWARRINAVHVHHTWRPNHAQWRGQPTVEAIRRYHVEQLGWFDIAEHLTIGADGSLWTGRHLDRPPASASGHNGSAREGPLMIEMVGDFDVGQDRFDGAQAEVAYQTVADICAAFELHPTAVHFHNEFTAAKSCPGTALRLDAFRAAVAERMSRREADARAWPSAAARAYVAQVALASPVPRSLEPADAEPPHDARQAEFAWLPVAGDRGFGAEFTDEQIGVFNTHVVNLSGGQLSEDGSYSNSAAGLDGLIANLDRWVAERDGRSARIVFFAHGGLVDERSGLDICLRDHHWWLANEVYPVFFVWETGFFESLRQHAQRDRAWQAQRAFFTDPLLEATLGPTVGRPVWDRIKTNALLSSAQLTGNGGPGGAARFAAKFARWFATLSQPARRAVTLHAVGHSAGSIFHCHFLPALDQAFSGVQDVPAPLMKTLAFLAPAVRVDLFKQMLLARVGHSIGALSMFTMARGDERRDNVIGIYRKSLLYFVRNACEHPPHSTPILGLEESVRGDAELAALFGLGSEPAQADVIWSPTATGSGHAASQARHHGDFDEDSPTMNSVLRRILDLDDAAALPCPHLPVARPVDERVLIAPGYDRSTADGGASGNTAISHRISRRALCIGIDAYGAQSLDGCVADAQSFARSLRDWGFVAQELINEGATRAAILAGIDGLLAGARTGDIVAIQFAGHGTQLPDSSGDEGDGFDEAWVPYDYVDGKFVIDDDIGAAFDRHRARGIELVIFTDCCNSGTSTRMFVHPTAPQLAKHSRFLPIPRDIVERYLVRRRGGQAAARFGQADGLGWEIHFAACQDLQSAYEHDGHGDFTRAATSALAAALELPTCYDGLAATILAAFAGNALQTPKLRAQPASARLPLFRSSAQPGAMSPAGATAADLSAVVGVPVDPGARLEQLSARIDALADKIDAL